MRSNPRVTLNAYSKLPCTKTYFTKRIVVLYPSLVFEEYYMGGFSFGCKKKHRQCG